MLFLLWQFVELGSLREVKGLVALLVGRAIGENYGENERASKSQNRNGKNRLCLRFTLVVICLTVVCI